MELKPKPVELPRRQGQQQLNKSVPVVEQEQRPQKTSLSHKKNKKQPESFEGVSNDLIGSFIGLIAGFICAGGFFFFVAHDIVPGIVLKGGSFSEFNWQKIEKHEIFLIVIISLFSLMVLRFLFTAIFSFGRATINFIRYKNSNSSVQQKEMAIKQEIARQNNENKNEYSGLIVNGRELTPEETKEFIKNAKKLINIIGYVMTFIAAVAALTGNIWGGIVFFIATFFLRKKILSVLDKTEAETSKRIAQISSVLKTDFHDGWMNGNAKRATPEELKKGLIFLNVFIGVCFLLCFFQGIIAAGIVGLFLIFIRKSMVKQIKEDEAKSPGNEETENDK